MKLGRLPFRYRDKAAIACMAVVVLSAATARAEDDKVRSSVVQIFATERKPDFQRPWTKGQASEVRGTGVVIDGKRILTNSHVVAYASQIFVQPYQSADKLVAKVVAEGPGIDLAVLSLEDESFFEKHPPIERSSKIPEIKEPILTYGYPEGGSSLSITRGIVSRIEFRDIDFDTSGLRMQIDAAINPGNSGGPAVIDNKLVGVVFSHLPEADNIGYVIATEEIELFLEDVADGKYDGKPGFHMGFATIENDALRGKLGLEKSESGVVINQLDNPKESSFKNWDVLTHVGEYAVDNVGMVQISEHLRLPFAYLCKKLSKDGKLPVRIIREGKRLALEANVKSEPDYVMKYLKGKYPSYFVFGPLVFCPATVDFIDFISGRAEWTEWLAEGESPLLLRRFDSKKTPGEQVVVVGAPSFRTRLPRAMEIRTPFRSRP